MVDFKKKLGGSTGEKPTDPVKLYNSLDRAHDKGPLRPAQSSVLETWFAKQQSQRDVIVKLHTGQGKTLVGLLMLQSRLNSKLGPVVYLCPNNYLVDQTREQARQFGIRTCVSDGELPADFINSRSILVTSAQKLFNGLTKFGLHRQSVKIDTILMDDAHACSDVIRDQCRIKIPSDEPAYSALKSLFASDLEQQGIGTFADIENGKRDAFLAVPYWAWIPREAEVAQILSKEAARKSIKYAWPLLKDIIKHCQCLLSGSTVEIEPYIAPLSAFGSYANATHRIFMSATVTDDAFLIKGLQLSPQTVANPLTYAKETWSGEKMILIPSLIHEDLNHSAMLEQYAPPGPKRKYGRVALVPSFARAKPWETLKAVVADTDSISTHIDNLKKGEVENTIVLANRYDGVDLPDSACRILIFDSKPFSENLIDLYHERCRPESAATLMRTVRSVEQGMGRSVRGEKDYSVIVAIGSDLSRLLRDTTSRRFLSSQMSTQITIGLEIAEMARQEIDEGKEPMAAFRELANQCLGRDEGWKAYYASEMAAVTPTGADEKVLNIYSEELAAESSYIAGDYADAAKRLQALLDSGTVDRDETGWYLQEQARFNFVANRGESEKLQIAGHKKNRLLLKPASGVTVTKLTIVSQGRTERVRRWLSKHADYAELNVVVTDILGRLVFGVKADKFESALNELSFALGFVGERPDSEWNEGPDNLWALDDHNYLLFECKSEVDVKRSEINKREAEQMNRSSAWFDKHYLGMNVARLIIHPAGKIESAAAFTHDVEGVRESDLKRLVKSARDFFKSFESRDLKDLSEEHIQKLLNSHQLSATDLMKKYSRKLKDLT